MAITERTATVAESASATTITGTIPASSVAGDVLVAVFGLSCTVAQLTEPAAAWTQLITPNEFNAGIETFAAYYKVAVGSDAGPTCTSSGAAGRITCLMQAYIGVDNVTPIDVAAVVTTNASTNALACTGVTTVTDGAMVISGITGDWSTGTWTAPTSTLALTLQKAHTSGTGRATALADGIKSPLGATGTETWSDTAAVLHEAGFVGALRPSVAAQASLIPVHLPFMQGGL